MKKIKSKKWQLFEAKNYVKDDPLGYQVYKYIRSLALLPKEDIPGEGIEVVRGIIDRNFKDNPKRREKWTRFLNNYIIGYWIIKRKMVFCVFWQIDRTNNFTESNNHLMNTAIRAKPSVGLFIRKYDESE